MVELSPDIVLAPLEVILIRTHQDMLVRGGAIFKRVTVSTVISSRHSVPNPKMRQRLRSVITGVWTRISRNEVMVM